MPEILTKTNDYLRKLLQDLHTIGINYQDSDMETNVLFTMDRKALQSILNQSSPNFENDLKRILNNRTISSLPGLSLIHISEPTRRS